MICLRPPITPSAYLLVASKGLCESDLPALYEKDGEDLDINDRVVRNRIIRAGVARPFFSWLEHQERVIEYGEMEFESGHELIMPMAKSIFPMWMRRFVCR